MTIPKETLGLGLRPREDQHKEKVSDFVFLFLTLCTVDLSFPYHTLYGSVLELQLDLASDDADLISRFSPWTQYKNGDKRLTKQLACARE